MQFDFPSRLAKLQKLLERKRIPALVLCGLEGFDANVYYYSGDETFPTTLLVTPDHSIIYSLHPTDFSHLFNDCLPLSELRKGLRRQLKQLRVRELAVDDFSASAGAFLRLRKKTRIELAPFGLELARQRLIKEPVELECIQRAREISLKAAKELDGNYFAGKTEHEVAGGMELAARRLGASLDAFPTMVLSGERSAFFHNSTSSKRIVPGELVLVDWGSRFNHYCSDHTLTFYEGRDKKMRDAVEAVKEAKKAAERKLKNGVLGKTLSKAALDILEEYGFANHSYRKTGLSLGHFVGLDVHDAGVGMEKTRLRPGMAFTIEPGVYIPGEFGVRFEDTYVLD